MFGFDSPIYTVSALALLALAVFGLYEIFSLLRHRNFLEHKDFMVLSLDQAKLGMSVRDFIQSIRPPFTFEIAVHQIGKRVNYYLVMPRKRAQSLVGLGGISEAQDYALFHPGGEHVGLYLKGDGQWPKVDLSKINFSKVNEVGEGVVVQFVFGRKHSKQLGVNFRILVSAPSNFQAKEIVTAIKPAFAEYTFVESASDEFLHRVSYREFNRAEEALWRVAS